MALTRAKDTLNLLAMWSGVGLDAPGRYAPVYRKAVLLQKNLQVALRDFAVSRSVAQGQAYRKAEGRRTWLYQWRNFTLPSCNSRMVLKSSWNTNLDFQVRFDLSKMPIAPFCDTLAQTQQATSRQGERPKHFKLGRKPFGRRPEDHAGS